MRGAVAIALLFTSVATASSLGQTVPGCIPAYHTMEPDFGPYHHFEVKIVDAKTHVVRWMWNYVHTSEPCCQWTRNAISDIVRRLSDPMVLITIGDCR